MIIPALAKIIKENKHLQQHQYIGGFEDEADVFLWYRKPDNYNKREVVKVPNVPRYFCLTEADFHKLPKEVLEEAKKGYGYFDNGKVMNGHAYFFQNKIKPRQGFYNWLTVTEDTYGVKWLEADISRLQRVMIDLELSVASPDQNNGPRLAFFDIETDDRTGKPNPGEDRILSIVWKDNEAEHFLRCEADTDEAEKEFLTKVMKELTAYDVLVGYNNYNFDDVCLEGRFQKYGLDTTFWRRIATLDIYNLMERQGTFRAYGVPNRKLDTIAKTLLGRGKVPHTEKIFDLWQNNPALLEEYNYEDVRLIFDMEKKLGSVGLVLSVCSTAGLLHSIGYSPAKTVDTFMLRKAAEMRKSDMDFRYPTQYYRPEHNGNKSKFTRNALPSDKRKDRKTYLKEEFDIDYEPVEGAIVLDTKPGLYKDVYFCDFNSLYPNAIRAFNIGLDTLVDEKCKYPKCKSPDGDFYFRTDRISHMAACVEGLLDMRANIRSKMKGETDSVILQALDIRQRGVKELTNSFYGVCAQYGGRYFSKAVAEAITGSGRLFLPFGQKLVEEMGYKVALGDTDSLAIEIHDENVSAEVVKDTFLAKLREMLVNDYNIKRPEVLKMSVERKASALLIVAKKLYALMQVVKDGKPCSPSLVIKGLGITKGNAPKWSAEFCKTILVDILSGDKDADYFIRKLDAEKQRLANGEIPVSKLLISARVGKELDEYVGENPLVHVRVARRLVEKGQLVPAYTTITYLVTEGNGKHIEAIDESEIQIGSKYDAAYLWNVFIMQQAGEYLSIAYPEIEWDNYRFPKNLKRNPFELKLEVKNV